MILKTKLVDPNVKVGENPIEKDVLIVGKDIVAVVKYGDVIVLDGSEECSLIVLANGDTMLVPHSVEEIETVIGREYGPVVYMDR